MWKWHLLLSCEEEPSLGSLSLSSVNLGTNYELLEFYILVIFFSILLAKERANNAFLYFNYFQAAAKHTLHLIILLFVLVD